MSFSVEHGLVDAWYRKAWWLYLLWPLSLLFALISFLRRCWQQRRAGDLPVPVVVVGNITLGGTGKTPLLMALLRHLQEQGWRPGVVSRGYGGRAAQVYPLRVTGDSDPAQAGDEPCEIARRTGAPVSVAPRRLEAARQLLADGCDIILSDDGLQHYRLPRHLELAVLDGQRLLGNGLRLPAGPLREGMGRLRRVDWVLVNGEPQHWPVTGVAAQSMVLEADCWRRLADDRALPLAALPGDGRADGRVQALAGIGNPSRFFQTLEGLGLSVEAHTFPDHWQYRREDLAFARGDRPLVMTAKDAVKCRALAADLPEETYYLEVSARLPEPFWRDFDDRIRRVAEALAPARSSEHRSPSQHSPDQDSP